ncbi:alpha beta-hydrolase [Apiospora arundinis]
MASLLPWVRLLTVSPPLAFYQWLVSGTNRRHTQLYETQAGGKSFSNYPNTASPFFLLVVDVYYTFYYAWALPWLAFPLWPWGSGHFDEFSPTLKNLTCLLVHGILFFEQLSLFFFLPFMVFLPIWAVAAEVVIWYMVDSVIRKLLNGSSFTFHSDPRYAKPSEENAHESWIYLNGILIGEHWMQSHLNRLALTFKRPILGMHNKTSGLIFDSLQAIMQRCFSYGTVNIRKTMHVVKDELYKPEKTKVILLLHSQGAIEGALVIDWLLEEVPRDLLAKLEVYTFGAAANHMSSPRKYTGNRTLGQSTQVNGVRTSDISALNSGLIRYIEHYTFSTDPISLTGVLLFSRNIPSTYPPPNYGGCVFQSNTLRGGHQFIQHYLDGMFPLARTDNGDFVGCAETNEFMESTVDFVERSSDQVEERVIPRVLSEATIMAIDGDPDGSVENGKRVKDYSRLWLYRNGLCPPA